MILLAHKLNCHGCNDFIIYTWLQIVAFLYYTNYTVTASVCTLYSVYPKYYVTVLTSALPTIATRLCVQGVLQIVCKLPLLY